MYFSIYRKYKKSLDWNEAQLTDDPVAVETEMLLGVVGLKGDGVKHLVDRVVGAHHPNEPDDPGGEVQLLPRPAQVLRVVNHTYPVFLVH